MLTRDQILHCLDTLAAEAKERRDALNIMQRENDVALQQIDQLRTLIEADRLEVARFAKNEQRTFDAHSFAARLHERGAA